MEAKKMERQNVSSLASLMNAYERALIIDALVSTQGNQSQAAKLLGTSKRVIHYKIHKFGIDPRRFRMGIKSLRPWQNKLQFRTSKMPNDNIVPYQRTERPAPRI